MKTQTEAVRNFDFHYCENCKKPQQVMLTKYDPDEDEEPNLIVCLVCGEAIGFIETL